MTTQLTSQWYAKGKDPLWAYRAPEQVASKYLYNQGGIAFYSKEQRIPAEVFSKIINHYLSNEHACSEIAQLERQYNVLSVASYEDEKDLATKGTITGGISYFTDTTVKVIDRSSHLNALQN